MKEASKFLFDAVKKDSIYDAQQALKAGAEINALNHDAYTPLQIAASLGRTSMMKFLINESAEIDTINHFSSTPLHLAVKSGQIKAVKLLVKSNCQKNRQDYFGFTPLHLAAAKGCLEIAKYLLSSGATILNTYNGWSPLHLSVSTNNINIVRLLSQHCDVNQKDHLGLSPLSNSLTCRNIGIAEYLISQGSKLTELIIKRAEEIHKGLGESFKSISLKYLIKKSTKLVSDVFQAALQLAKLPDLPSFLIAKISSCIDTDNLLHESVTVQLANSAVKLNYQHDRARQQGSENDAQYLNGITVEVSRSRLQVMNSPRQLDHLNKQVLSR